MPVPGIIADELVAEQVAAFVGAIRRDRAGVELPSQIVRVLAGDPTVRCVNIQVAVVV